ncbi:hypothetical protein L486_00994 [Kwoniella mangroviensis CBS 10435]|uniref:Uncharacterized protein n=1 Tax=Kwoniella mangroviensis CBS 10435 TaxID=1331196 RepID=A0A1B9J0N5_9TREE|nr:hypothetical protein L486_00994 [Kwoniella mangroviensis CBS 10435]OCF77365.1 hypothetical protein I204_01353 [Kwoniella mangroviensis CBS 8886]
MSAVHGNLSHAMRDNYNEHGVDEYYRKVAATYRNPFYPGIKKVIWTFMNRWWEAEGRSMYGSQATDDSTLRVLDMAAGSGEATLCLLEWAQSTRDFTSSSSAQSPVSLPPTSQFSQAVPPDPLAALRAMQSPVGSGSSRPAFIPSNARRPAQGQSSNRKGKQVFGGMDPPELPADFGIGIEATDPFTSPAYTERTSRSCHSLSFTDLANGLLPDDTPQPKDGGPIWDMIICSFALHLVTSPSELFALLYELSGKAKWLVIIAPHKKPEIKETWGWSRYDIASWSAAGEAKLYGGSGKGSIANADDDEEETELEIVRDNLFSPYRSAQPMTPSSPSVL